MGKETFSFKGRVDGLGNRLEEVIRLEALCKQTDKSCQYHWTNEHEHRSYPVLFSADNVEIVEGFENPESVFQIAEVPGPFTQHEYLAAGKTILPSFEIQFKDNIQPVGIHIRGSDRIGGDHPHFMKNEDEFKSYLVKTIHCLNTIKPKHVFICADRNHYKDAVLSLLDRQISIVEPVCDQGICSVYQDFFALTLCSKIFMASRFSSFAITASLIANIPVHCFFKDPAVAKRYEALFEYELDFAGPRKFDFLNLNRPRDTWTRIKGRAGNLIDKLIKA